MSDKSEFSSLRARLDEAITYGAHQDALHLARQGLEDALAGNLPGEIEYFKGQEEFLNNNFTVAIGHFDAALKHNPNDGAAYNDRALCMVELGVIDEAFYYFDKGIEVEPDYATVYHNKGCLLNNIGRHSEAIRYFNKALELEPRRPVTYDNLADALLSLLDYQGALQAYRKVLELLKPDSCHEIRQEISRQIKAIEDKLKEEKP